MPGVNHPDNGLESSRRDIVLEAPKACSWPTVLALYDDWLERQEVAWASKRI